MSGGFVEARTNLVDCVFGHEKFAKQKFQKNEIRLLEARRFFFGLKFRKTKNFSKNKNWKLISFWIFTSTFPSIDHLEILLERWVFPG